MKSWAEWTPQTCGTVPPTVQWIQKRGSRVLRVPGSSQSPLSSAPAGWLDFPCLHYTAGAGDAFSSSFSWSELTQDGMSVHCLSLVLLHYVSFRHCPSPLPGASLQTPPLQEWIFVRCHLCLLAAAVLSARWFPLYAPFSSNRCASSDISLPLRAPCLSFYKGLSCVLSSNPFKTPCTFLNDGNPLTRRGRWESWEWHQRGLLNLLWQQGRGC